MHVMRIFKQFISEYPTVSDVGFLEYRNLFKTQKTGKQLIYMRESPYRDTSKARLHSSTTSNRVFHVW